MTSTRRASPGVIRGMTRLALQYNAVNLAQWLPDRGAGGDRALPDAIAADVNQYAIIARPFAQRHRLLVQQDAAAA